MIKLTEQKIAIYIPSHNREELCKKLVSNLREFNKEIPIYVVTDKSQEYNISDCQIVKIEDEGKGLVNARNFCIKCANELGYTHLFFIDDDIHFFDNPFNSFHYFEENENLCWLGFSTNISKFIIKYKKEEGLLYSARHGNQAFIIDLKKLSNIGLFEEVIDDLDMTFRVLKYGYDKAIDKNIFYHSGKCIGIGGCSDSHNGKYIDKFIENTKILNIKYGYELMRVSNKNRIKNSYGILTNFVFAFKYIFKVDSRKYGYKFEIRKRQRSLFDF